MNMGKLQDKTYLISDQFGKLKISEISFLPNCISKFDLKWFTVKQSHLKPGFEFLFNLNVSKRQLSFCSFSKLYFPVFEKNIYIKYQFTLPPSFTKFEIISLCFPYPGILLKPEFLMFKSMSKLSTIAIKHYAV